MTRAPRIVERVVQADLFCVYNTLGELVAAYPDRESAEARLWIESMT